jgi:hypothetical protein
MRRPAALAAAEPVASAAPPAAEAAPVALRLGARHGAAAPLATRASPALGAATPPVAVAVAPPAIPAVAPLGAAPAIRGALPRPIALPLPRPIGTAVGRGVEGAIVPVHGALFPNLVGAPTIGASCGRLKQRREFRSGLRTRLWPMVPSLLTSHVGGAGTLCRRAPLGRSASRIGGRLLTATTGVPLRRATWATPTPGTPLGAGTAGGTLGRQRGRGRRRRIEIGRLIGASARGGALAGTATTGTGLFVAHGLRDMWYGNRPARPGRGAGGNPRGRGTTVGRKDRHVATHEDATTAATTRGNLRKPGWGGCTSPRQPGRCERQRGGTTAAGGEATGARLAGKRPGGVSCRGIRGEPACQHQVPASTRTLRGRRPVTRASLAGPASAPSAVCSNSPVPSRLPRYTGTIATGAAPRNPAPPRPWCGGGGGR